MNGFKGFLAVVSMSFRTWWRDKASVFWGIVFPLLLMGLIGLVFGSSDNLHFSVSVAALEGDPVATGALEAFKSIEPFHVVEEPTDVGLAKLESGDRSLVVVLPAMQGGVPGGEVVVYYDESNMQVSQAGVAIVRQVVEEINKGLTGREDVVTFRAEGIAAEEFSMFDFLLPGIMAMTLMQTGLMGVTYVVATYRERLVLKRVLATPFPPFAFLSGLVARFTVVNLIQILIIFLVATFVFGARTVGSLWQLAILCVIGSVAFLAMGFAVSTVSKTAESANTLGSVINFPMLFLSGTFWPKEMLPEAIRPIVSALPLTPLVDSMRGVGAMGDSLLQYTPGILYLLAWAVAGFALAAWKFKWE